MLRRAKTAAQMTKLWKMFFCFILTSYSKSISIYHNELLCSYFWTLSKKYEVLTHALFLVKTIPSEKLLRNITILHGLHTGHSKHLLKRNQQKCSSFWLLLWGKFQLLPPFQDKTIVCLLIKHISNVYIEEDSFWNHVEIKTAYIYRAHILHYIEIVYLICQEGQIFFQHQCAAWSNKSHTCE